MEKIYQSEHNGVRLKIVLTTQDTQSHSRLSDYLNKIDFTIDEQDLKNWLASLAESVAKNTDVKG